MTPWPRLLLLELRHRWHSAALTALVVAAATGTVAFFKVQAAMVNQETTRIQRDIGPNLVFLPADEGAYLRGEVSDATLSADLLLKLKRPEFNHLTPILERRAAIETHYLGRSVSVPARIIGLEGSQGGSGQSPMRLGVQHGTVELGASLAADLGHPPVGTAFRIAGHDVKLARVNLPTGTASDVTAFLDLGETQDIFHLPGRLSRIEAVECLDCQTNGQTTAPDVERAAHQVDPTLQVVRKQAAAEARARQRALTASAARRLSPLLLLTAAAATAGLALLNALGRLRELALWRIFGRDALSLAALLSCRATLCASFGAALGLTTGAACAAASAPVLLHATTASPIPWSELGTTLFSAAGLASLAGALPAFWAAARPPADTLSE